MYLAKIARNTVTNNPVTKTANNPSNTGTTVLLNNGFFTVGLLYQADFINQE